MPRVSKPGPRFAEVAGTLTVTFLPISEVMIIS
jgi:hypothetical protein